MIYDPRSIAHDGEMLDLDPFAFWPSYRSRLEGVGGGEPSEDPDYVFHTLYVACGSGPITYRVAIDGLTATRGTLILRIHELPDGVGSSARALAISQAQLVDLIREGGSVALEAEARSGNTYALLGHIYGDTPARADSLTVTVTREEPDPHAPNRASTYTSSRVAAGTVLIGTMVPTMIAPVSQMPTEPQYRETVFREWAERLGAPRRDQSLALWEQVLTARALDRYDMARIGARGLMIDGDACPRLVAELANLGCVMTVSYRPQEHVAPAVDSQRVAFDPMVIPDDMGGFDFVCALRVFEQTGKWKDVLARIEDLLRLVKPHGLLIVTLDIVLLDDAPDGADGPGWHDLARIAMVLLSRGHQVAQLRRDFKRAIVADENVEPAMSTFGFIVRRRL